MAEIVGQLGTLWACTSFCIYKETKQLCMLLSAWQAGTADTAWGVYHACCQ